MEGAGRENVILESHVDNGVSFQQIIKLCFRQFWRHGRNALRAIWQKFPLKCILLNIGKERSPNSYFYVKLQKCKINDSINPSFAKVQSRQTFIYVHMVILTMHNQFMLFSETAKLFTCAQ